MLNFIKIAIVLFVVASFHTTAHAHSKITTTKPENGAILQEIPTAIQLNFGNKIRLTKVTLQHIEHHSEQHTEQKAVNLILSNDKGFKNHFSLPMASQGNGVYTINWRGLSIDGHVMQGKLSFTVE